MVCSAETFPNRQKEEGESFRLFSTPMFMFRNIFLRAVATTVNERVGKERKSNYYYTG